MRGEPRSTASASSVASIRGAGRPRSTGVTRGFSGILSGVVMLFDVLAVVALLYYFTVERTGGFASPYVTLAAITAVLMPIVYRANGVSHRMRLGGWLVESTVLLRAWLITLMFLVTLSFLTKTTETFSREALLKWVLAGYVAQVTIHGLIRFALSRLRSRGLNVRYAVVVGRGAGLGDFVELMQRNRWIGIDVVGRSISTNWKRSTRTIRRTRVLVPTRLELSRPTAVVARGGYDLLHAARKRRIGGSRPWPSASPGKPLRSTGFPICPRWFC